MVTERSAYISYCSDKWWETESVAYVRRSLIHPSYSYRDRTRRHHYNIGAVQVITSMINNCVGWSPISLVSHKFVINEKGFPATAIGWGLDRYNTRYLSYHLPKRPLVAYEGLIFPKSCPKQGEHQYNTRYLSYHLPKRPLVAYEGLIFPKSCPKQGEHNNEEYERELNVKNMYCLSLPYMGDKKDTAHGSLLLVQGKLMALSLQKGKSNRNESTAQYTGVWRLVPWVLEVTRNSTNDTLTTKMIAI
ncbi:hypothetical protein RR46_10997 [Papilio xuthus]|uniref:Peptidase S1 domain-containing protein n=1 Tax=Papilio xuthus TaxID=66420 RepID=A0A194PWZ2_PAPXU|nr:hypothetical protein RR46_10997 [Papilio xuthus]